ncbi:MAG: hypothetical protein K9K63_14520 [Desulfotignum sp.]|nr:hypothetical protein [Desulfotignum sp.]MCF8138514.1 hypothetical protein [Desulfotignum sp.]
MDFFFRSLAQDQHERVIGVMLSSTGSDGTLGCGPSKARVVWYWGVLAGKDNPDMARLA